MKNFTIYNEGKYDIKANASLKAEALGVAAGRFTVNSLKFTARTLLNATEHAIKGQGITEEAFQSIGL